MRSFIVRHIITLLTLTVQICCSAPPFRGRRTAQLLSGRQYSLTRSPTLYDGKMLSKKETDRGPRDRTASTSRSLGSAVLRIHVKYPFPLLPFRIRNDFPSGSLVGMTSRNLCIILHNQYVRVQYLKSTAAVTACLAIGHKTRDSGAHDVGGDSLNREKVELTNKRTSERHGRTTERPPVVSREKVRVRLLIASLPSCRFQTSISSVVSPRC